MFCLGNVGVWLGFFGDVGFKLFLLGWISWDVMLNVNLLSKLSFIEVVKVIRI